jgi:hypothetical protein
VWWGRGWLDMFTALRHVSWLLFSSCFEGDCFFFKNQNHQSRDY